MTSEAVAAYDNSTATTPSPPAGTLELQKVEEQLEVVQQDSIDGTPKEKVDQVTMSTTDPPAEEEEEEDKKDKTEKQAEPESVPESEVHEKPEEASALNPVEKVKVEIGEEEVEKFTNKSNNPETSVEDQKETLELDGSAELKVVEENETSKEVFLENEKPKEVIIETTKVPESSEALVEPEKTLEAEECKAAREETVEGEEEKMEVLESISEVKDEVVEKLQVVQAESAEEQETAVEEEIEAGEETKPRESLGALMKKEVTEEKGSESSDEVAVIDKEVQVDDEAVGSEHEEKEEKCGEAKKVEEVLEQLAQEVTAAEDKLGKNGINREVEELKKDDVSLINGAAQVSVQLVSESVIATADEATKISAEMEVTAPIVECRDSAAKKEMDPSELIKDREVEEVMSKEKSTKDADDTKDMPKVEAVAKPVSKQSNNIMSKVKQSLVKAKKAIIGKSPSSKSISTEIKGDITVK